MAIVINGSGTVTGLAVGGLPDGTVDAGTLAANSVDSAELIDGAVDDSHMASIKGRKNIMFNGAMQVSQRTTSTTGVTSATYGACDRYKLIINGGGTFTISQENDAPAGFYKSLKANCTTAQGSLGANDYGYVSQKIESQDTKHLAYGTSSAKTITLSFWVKCSQTGTLQAGIVHYASGGNRHIGGTYVINAADTWEQKTMTFAGDTTRVGNFDTARGFEVEWFLISGSARTGGSVPSSWGTMAQTNRNAGSNISIGDSTSDTWQITGVQLEVGSVATDFEHRRIGEELSLCQRYYYELQVGSGTFAGISVGSTSVRFPVILPVPLRAEPSIASNGNKTHRSGNVNSSVNQVTVSGYFPNMVQLKLAGAGHSSLSDENIYSVEISTQPVLLDAEL